MADYVFYATALFSRDTPCSQECCCRVGLGRFGGATTQRSVACPRARKEAVEVSLPRRCGWGFAVPSRTREGKSRFTATVVESSLDMPTYPRAGNIAPSTNRSLLWFDVWKQPAPAAPFCVGTTREARHVCSPPGWPPERARRNSRGCLVWFMVALFGSWLPCLVRALSTSLLTCVNPLCAGAEIRRLSGSGFDTKAHSCD